MVKLTKRRTAMMAVLVVVIIAACGGGIFWFVTHRSPSNNATDAAEQRKQLIYADYYKNIAQLDRQIEASNDSATQQSLCQQKLQQYQAMGDQAGANQVVEQMVEKWSDDYIVRSFAGDYYSGQLGNNPTKAREEYSAALDLVNKQSGEAVASMRNYLETRLSELAN